jgi:mono/diheme cytochrome c family protein
MTGRRLLVLLVLALALAALPILVAGCGGDDDGADATPPVVDTGAADDGAETPAEPAGDPEAGKTVFADAGCGNCHTLADAGAEGAVGPSLDQLQPDFETIVQQVTNGGGGMPAYRDELSAQQILDVAAYVASVTGS